MHIQHNNFRNMAEVEAAADAFLSNFNGPSLEEYDGDYTGYGDDFVDFDGGANSFANEVQTGRRFTVVIDNSDVPETPGGVSDITDKTVILLPSFDPKGGTVLLNGEQTIGGQTVNVTGQPASLVSLQNFIKSNPMRCLGMKVESTNVLQLGMSLTIAPKSPFRNLESETIFFSDYKDEKQYQDKIVTIQRPFQVDNQTDIILNLCRNSITTITFFFGASLNTAKALKKKSDTANAHLRPLAHRI